MKKIAFKIGLVIIAVFVLLAIFAPFLAPHDPSQYHINLAFASSSHSYLFGNDADGRDILSRLIYGTRISLGISITVVGISLCLGTIIGLIAGYYGGYIDRLFIFVSDVFMSFPSFLFAIAVAAFLSPSVLNIIIILSIKGWVTYARLVRGQTKMIKEKDFVLAERAVGVRIPYLFRKHLFPNMIGPVLINMSFGIAGVILIESALSFLGLGVPVNVPSWGAMIDQGTQYLLVAPRLSIFPGLAIMLLVLGFNLVGEGLRDKFAARDR